MTLVTLFMFVSPMLGGSQIKVPNITVCELLQNLGRFNGQDVAVRGEWVHTEHGIYLRHRCPVFLTTEGHRWPNSVWIQFPWLETDESIHRGFDKSKLEVAQSKIDEVMSKSRPGVAVYATITGIVQTRDPPGVIKRPDGRKIGNGFGHLNSFAAQIVPRSIDHIGLYPK